nr:MAG TPA: hypothetical protein [Caudoviricetes sp.]
MICMVINLKIITKYTVNCHKLNYDILAKNI